MSGGLDLHAARALAERPRTARLLALLDADGEESRIVGGAVRNALVGRPVTEVDIATTALPEAVGRRARAGGLRAIPTGLAHGTVTVLVDGEAFEVTTLREDVATDGRHAAVRFGRDFAADAQRRDFTVNALSIGRDGVLHDDTGGLDDLAARRMRFIGDPAARIREDYLRILRFFRFHAADAEGPLDPAGLDAAIRGRDGLAILSRERVRAELLKLLATPRAAEVAAAMGESGLLGRLVAIPGEFGRLGRAGGDPLLGLAALFVRETGDAPRLRDALRLSNAETERLAAYGAALARLRSPAVVDAAELRRTAAVHGVPALLDALAATAGEPRPRLDREAAALAGRYGRGDEGAPVFPLTGADLVRAGLPPGPEIGRRLAAERAAWLAAGCPAEVPG